MDFSNVELIHIIGGVSFLAIVFLAVILISFYGMYFVEVEVDLEEELKKKIKIRDRNHFAKLLVFGLFSSLTVTSLIINGTLAILGLIDFSLVNYIITFVTIFSITIFYGVTIIYICTRGSNRDENFEKFLSYVPESKRKLLEKIKIEK